jgi:hypothetical protein
VVDVGNYGKENDAQIFNNCVMGKAFLSNQMHTPAPQMAIRFPMLL